MDFNPNRDWRIIFLIAALILTIIVIVFPFESGEVNALLKGFCVALIGAYGGTVGKGAKANPPVTLGATFGLPTGAVRGISAVVIAIVPIMLLAIVGRELVLEDLTFLVTMFSGLAGMAVAPYIPGS
ncbi:MAG: hypothetical protein JSW11_08870 [Candidatus Heimdallarchaeota archaeon]|nr:MAG: hypothetical protein JSW11_08870 [Candidatus Heimdallarchaeota archaeon]